MDYLPEEITANIISHLAKDGGDNDWDFKTTLSRGLSQYATVSRRWQQSVEAITFALVTLTPARLSSPLAVQALTPDRVRRFVRCIRADVLLPLYDKGARGRREDAMERGGADALFASFIRQVFALLSWSPGVRSAEVYGEGDGCQGQLPQQPMGVNATTGYRSKIRLSLIARCASDTEDMEVRNNRRFMGALSTEDMFEARYESSYLDLMPAAGQSVQDMAEALPELPCISHFRVQATPGLGSRHFSPRALCLIASRMSGLETVGTGNFAITRRGM